MTREEEKNKIAHEIAWESTKHYDPTLSKESWCEMAARAAIDWADEHPVNSDGKAMLHVLNKGHEQGYKDAINKACEFFNKRMWEMNAPDGEAYVVDGESSSISEFIRNFKDYMEAGQGIW